MDLTADFRKIASTYAANTDIPRSISPNHQPDLFVKEAYTLHSQLLELGKFLDSTRRAYLSTSNSKVPHLQRPNQKDNGEVQQLTDPQRDEIDYEVKKNITELSHRIKALESLESKRRALQSSTVPSFLSFLPGEARVKAINDLVSTHHSNVTWFLNWELLSLSHRHAESKTIRLQREEERRLSSAPRSITTSPRYAYDSALDPSATTSEPSTALESEMTVRETLMSATELQSLESENAEILEQFDAQLGQIKSVQSKLLEIAELSSELQAHLASQTELTDRLMSEAEQTTMDVSKGNEQLGLAKRRNKNTRLMFVTIFLTLAFTLLFLEYYSS